MKVATFKRRKAPAFLVSPSMTTGWDFPYDQCRWQIIAKVPIPVGLVLLDLVGLPLVVLVLVVRIMNRDHDEAAWSADWL
jgi:hypothetical protein